MFLSALVWLVCAVRRRYLPGVLAALLCSASLAAEYHYDGAHPPRFVVPRATVARPQLALVLGSGGRRGFAHAGVLRVLEAEGIKPDLILGVSIGAVIGSLYASGMSAADVEQLAMQLDLSALRELRLKVPTPPSHRPQSSSSSRREIRCTESLRAMSACLSSRRHPRPKWPAASALRDQDSATATR